jgi:hypothetical protein
MVDLVGDVIGLDDDQLKTLAEAIVMFGSKNGLGSKMEFYLSTALREEDSRKAAFEQTLVTLKEAA